MSLSITELLDPKAIVANLKADEKVAVIDEMCRALAKVYPIVDTSNVAKDILEREKLGSTGIGDGIAIPHCKMAGIDRLICLFAKSKKGVDFEAVDYRPVHLFFMLIAPENAAGMHLKALAKISKMCKNPEFRASISEAESEEEIYEIILKED